MKTSPRVDRIMAAEGISMSELERMVRLSAPHTADGMNRRYHQWLFNIQAGACDNMRLEALNTVGNLTPHGFMEEEHADCDGQGCRGCGWNGVVRRYL